MDNAALYSALIKFFSEEDISKTREGVFRAAQKSDGTTYSIQYFDSTQPFARDKFDISSYQMDLIGRDYYENPGSLQWNYYLNFLLDEEHLSDSSFSRIKTTIEADRSLARKRIVSLADLNLLLSHQFTPSSLPLPIDVRDIWYERLQELSLEEVLEKEISVDSVIDRYLTEGIEKKTSARNPKLGHVGKMPRLLHLDLQKYRKYPMMRKFRLSRVNLIRGANAVGKTSLMEAIELMVCGKTARNPDLDDAFRFSVRFEGDEKQAVVTKASDKIYRERDASWYGRAYLKGNELPSSFARFNFFDSDAAIRFSEEIENANFFEALKSIVFGTDIQQLERRLNSLGSKLKTTTNDAEVVLQNERAKELAIDTLLINLMASDSGTIAKDALMHRLLELDILPSLTEKPLSEIAGELASYVLVFDSSDIQSRPGHHTIRDIERTIAQATTVRDDFNKLTEKIASGETRLRQLKLSADITNVGLKSTRRLRQYEEVNGFVLFDSEDRLSALSESLKNLESIGSQWRDRPSAFHVNADNSVDSARSEVAVRRISIAAEVSQLRATKAVLLQTREKASLLISEIHERASELLALDVKMTDCPLCGESHISPSLAERVLSVKTASTVADAQIDELAEKELKAESELRVLVDVYEWIQDLQRWSEILNIEWQSTGIIAIGEKIRAALEKKSELDGDINSLQRLLDSLLKRGFSRSDLLATYKESGLPDIGPGNLSLALANRLGVLEKQFDQQTTEIAGLESVITESRNSQNDVIKSAGIFGTQQPSISELTVLIEQLKSFVLEFSKMNVGMSVSFDSDLVKIQSNLREAIQLVTINLDKERTSKEIADRNSEKNEITERIRKTTEKLNRSRTAQSSIQLLLEETGLNKRLDFFLKDNAQSIKEIFLKIHSPREFQDLKFGEERLEIFRIDTSEPSGPTVLSTGQRAALALSVFLTMNGMLKNGPDLLLFDDPIVYADDLNLLSFLDLLRDLAVLDSRQIFFSTANSRIADLFSRKFDFLKEDYSEFYLSRSEPEIEGEPSIH